MVNKDSFNKSFVQKGAICVMASYGIVIEYFSNNIFTIDHLLDNYVNEFNISCSSFSQNIQAKKHENISKHFHTYCRENNNMRGFDFIKQLHDENKLGTNKFCRIIGFKAQLQKISDEDICLIQKELIDNEAVAIVLYKANNSNFHAVAIGFDTAKKTYFYKDPEMNKIGNGNILSRKEIWEFIIFNHYLPTKNKGAIKETGQ
jgi:hypothetical protein